MGGEWENNSEDIAKAMITDYIKKVPISFYDHKVTEG